MKGLSVAVGLLLSVSAQGETLLLHDPDIRHDSILFTHAGDIWRTDRTGKDVIRLTSLAGEETNPAFSPDGRWIAFSAAPAGNTDVYIMPVAGGQPKRLTFHPDEDIVRGWSPDGGHILFSSPRALSYQRGGHLHEISPDGGLPRMLPLPVAIDGAWFPDGTRLAYQPFPSGNSGRAGWKGYRGGATPPIWIVDPRNGLLERIPHDGSNDEMPRVSGRFVWFLSDRSGTRHLWRYDSEGGLLADLTPDMVDDIGSFAVDDETLVLATGGRLHVLGPGMERPLALKLSLPADYPDRMAKFVPARGNIEDAVIAPDGRSVLLAARGELVTLPVGEGKARIITGNQVARDRSPLFFPDGKSIAWLSDFAGNYRLMTGDADGVGDRRSYELGDGVHGWFRLLAIAPDGSYILYEDGALGLWLISPGDGKSVRIAGHERRWRPFGFEVAISPDSRLIAYVRIGAGYRRELRVYDRETEKHAPVVVELASAGAPAFSPDGRYLWFTASTSEGPASPWLDMSSRERPVRRGVFAAILQEGDPSPVALLSGTTPSGNEGAKSSRLSRKGLDKLTERIVSIPITARDWRWLDFARDGSLLLLADEPDGTVEALPGSDREARASLYRYDLAARRETLLLSGLAQVSLGADRSQILLSQARGALGILASDAAPPVTPKALALDDIRIPVDPGEEWRQIFDESWRILRDFFYDPGHHGLDWNAVGARYHQFLPHVGTRAQLNRLLVAMISELGVGHARAFGGDLAADAVTPTKVGLLGADYRLEDGRTRITDILDPGPFIPFLAAPLAIPGLGVREGDYVLAIDGVALGVNDNIHRHLEGKVGLPTVLSLSHDAAGKTRYEIIVEPIPDERPLRRAAFAEANRRHVAAASGGRIGYVYLPNTAEDGFRAFNRFFFGQLDREAMIIDERGNGGGQAADYIVETLARTRLGLWRDRAGALFATPVGAVHGPKAMLIDHFAGSGGDFLPDAFRRLGLGPLIGTRTWGGLIGIGVAPKLVDGGTITSPHFRFIDPVTGTWRIENEGVAPDIEIDILPEDHLNGRDPQLDTGIAMLLQALRDRPATTEPPLPPYPRP